MIAPGVGALIPPALDGLCAALTAAGVPATADPLRARPGGAWVKATKVSAATFTAAELRVSVYLLAPDHGTTAAISTLAGLLDQALACAAFADHLDPEVPIDLAVSLVLPDNPSGFPAALATLNLDL